MHEQVNVWITSNPTALNAVKDLAQPFTALLKGKPESHFHLAWINALTDTLKNTKQLDRNIVGNFLDSDGARHERCQPETPVKG